MDLREVKQTYRASACLSIDRQMSISRFRASDAIPLGDMKRALAACIERPGHWTLSEDFGVD